MNDKKKQKILLVAQNDSLIENFKHLMEKEGIDIVFLRNEMDCLKLTDTENPDCIIIDYSEQNKDGFQLSHKLKNSFQTKFIPIIMITGKNEEIIIQGLNSGVDEFIEKDSKPEITLAKIKSMLRIKYLQDELKSMIVRDNLTGLYNYEYFLEVLKKELIRVKRYGQYLSCIMIDVDFFKLANDEYGHGFGDVVLKRISTILKNNCRLCDVVARYGGDEFLILMPNTDYKGALITAERIRNSVRNEKFQDENSDVYMKFSVSIGVSSVVEDDPKDIDEFIKFTGESLYAAKLAGRNTVILHKHVSRSQTIIEQIEQDEELKIFYSNLSEVASETQKHYFDSIKSLLISLDKKGKYFAGSSLKIAEISGLIAEQMGLSNAEKLTIKNASLIHDIGMLAVKDDILSKKSKLNKDEWIEIKKHPSTVFHILGSVKYIDDELRLVLNHHERFDGQGYPVGMQGSNIPLGARIINLSCAVEAILFGRPYKPAKSHNEITEELLKEAGAQFDPVIVMALFKLSQKNPPILEGWEAENKYIEELQRKISG